MHARLCAEGFRCAAVLEIAAVAFNNDFEFLGAVRIAPELIPLIVTSGVDFVRKAAA
jgi:hypothetical protein